MGYLLLPCHSPCAASLTLNIELRNLNKNLAAGLPHKNLQRGHTVYGMADMALSNASSITLQTSGVDVSPEIHHFYIFTLRKVVWLHS